MTRRLTRRKILAAGALTLALAALGGAPGTALAYESTGYGTMANLTCSGSTWTQWDSDTRDIQGTTSYALWSKAGDRWVRSSGQSSTAGPTRSTMMTLRWSGQRGRENQVMGTHTFSHLPGVYASGSGTFRCP